MKRAFIAQSGLSQLRLLFAMLLCLCAAMLTVAAVNGAKSQRKANAPTPPSGVLSVANPSLTYMEPAGAQVPNATGVALGAPNCTVPNSCSTFNLTIDPSVGVAAGGYDPTKYQIHMVWSWSLTTVDYDIFFEDAVGNVVAVNNSTADPSSIILPTTTPAGLYKIVIVLSTGAPIGYNGSVVLEQKPASTGICDPNVTNCTPPRYINYSAGPGQADNAGEPSLGVDFNPNVATLKDTSSPIFTTGIKRLNTGGVSFFTSGANEWRANFDDCPSPAVNVWEDVSAVTTQQFVLSDPIGFVDHYSSGQLGLTYPEPTTPGRVFSLDLIGGEGNSLASYSDTDGNSYLPGGTGGPGAGPDHQTIGGGPYNLNSNPPPPPQVVAYGSPNAIYYCSQNIVAEAQCSRSDDGGKTFGPGVPIFDPSQCTGGIHGHVKVAPDGTVYVPNSSCTTNGGTSGVAVSIDNGLTWIQYDVPGSTSSQDPSVGIGQNNIGKPAGNLSGTNTLYFGYVDGDGHAKVVHSGDRGATFSTPIDVGAPFGVQHAVFPVVVAGDDNRAAFAFVGTGPGIATSGTCDPYGATLNCANIWHLYVSTTYDGGNNWVTVDATPDDPVQQGTVCLQGTTCAGGRNLLDFNDFAIDAEGRGLVGYADGCVNCGNTFTGQSAADHGTVTRQSGGRRLFSHFDPVEPAVPASPQLVSATIQSPGVLVRWLQPDNGGSPVTSYNIYRGGVSNAEAFLATVNGVTNLQYFDAAPPAGNLFYYVKAVNAIGEGPHCGEVGLSSGPVESECQVPGVTKLTDPAGDTSAAVGVVTTPAPPGSDLLAFQIAQPYQSDNIPRLVFTISTDNGLAIQPTGSAWYVAIKKFDGTYKGVHMAWLPTAPTVPTFESYTPGANQSGGVDGRFVTPGTTMPVEATSNYLPPYNKVIIVVKASDLGLNPGDTITGFVSAVSMSTDPSHIVGAGATALFDMMPDSLAFTGSYTVDNNQVCRPNIAPTAKLTATPMSGVAPLLVNFDGSMSSDPDTAPPPDTIASYTLNYGDGSPVVTQASPAFQHTYSTPGDYVASLSVTDSRGKASTNSAQLTISVATGSVPMTGIVSRKTHGSAGTFDVVLPQPPATPLGVECRTGGTNGVFTMIFGFENTLTSVSSATVTTGTGSVSSSVIGTDPHQYIVNLTGVTNAQNITVTLNSVQDSANNSGNVTGTMSVLLGDTNADRFVNSADIGQTKAQSGSVLSGSNFREDVNLDGALNSADIGLVKSKSGTALP